MGESISLSFGGYLDDPESEWGRHSNPNAKPFEAISGTSCLVLLGEPGMGKSQTIEGERKAVTETIEQKGGTVLWLDLRSYGSEDRLVRSLFECEQFLTWTKGHHRLHIFLDSLDEGLLQIRVLASLLAEEFKKYPVDRLFLRIACRTADWPTSLEDGLRELWEEEAVKVYELTPLRCKDVIEAANAHGINPDVLLSEISRVEVTPLAIKPVTLNFLLKTYQRHRSLPKTQAELYLEGCRLLCEETNPDRRDARLKEALSADQRLAVAARIAAITVFANRYAVWTTVNQGDVPVEDVTIRELGGGREQAQGNEFEVGEHAIRETLEDTGLFSGRGPNRLGWAHQTYAEFLAAHYLKRHEVLPAQLMNLLILPGGPERRLTPQLRRTAAWLASMEPEVFREIVKTDPEVLLESDLAIVDVKDRAKLVESLLKLSDERQSLLQRDGSAYRNFKKLAHPNLAEQLRRYIYDNAKSPTAQQFAANIAMFCEERLLLNDFADIALDPSQAYSVRIAAACTVARIEDGEVKARLKPLALGLGADDPEDELKGWGLIAVWPTHITAEEVFTYLTPPKRKNILGAYKWFLSDHLAQRLQPAELLTALQWVKTYQMKARKPHLFEDLADAIMVRAWELLETPGVLEIFAGAALARLRNYEEIAGNSTARRKLGDSEQKRKQCLEVMITILSEREEDPFVLLRSGHTLVSARDIPWMVERLQASASEKIQQGWVRLIELVFDGQDPDQTDVILDACQNIPVLAEAFRWLCSPLEIDSPKAQKMREDYERRLERQNKEEILRSLTPAPAQRMRALLDECESGNISAWWRLNRVMTLELESTHYGDELEADLTVLPGWREADSTTKARIIAAAKAYLLEQDPKTHEWFGTNIIHRPAFAGYRALRLLLQEDPSWLSTISPEIWRKWAPVILAYPIPSGFGGEELCQELVKRAYEHAATEIIDCLIALIDKENEEHGFVFITSKIGGCWDTRLADALLEKLKDEKLKPQALSRLLSDLLGHKVDEARIFASALVSSPLPPEEERRAKVVAAACTLMTRTEDAGWSVLWPVMQRDSEFGKAVTSAVAYETGLGSMRVGQQLTTGQLADLYTWLVRQYPYAEDPKDEESHAISARESVAMWRDSLLQQLKGRGSSQACEAIQWIVNTFPELSWLKKVLLEAQTIALRPKWIPLKPEDILALVSDQQKRLVQSGEQLLDVLIESLHRLEKKLHGIQPAAIDLWDEISKKVYRPRDEGRFSDYVTRHLRDDLKDIFVRREVEFRRGEGSTPGERTDIHVDVGVKGPGEKEPERISAIIEVKGCWSTKLKQSMKTQLVDRYLNDNPCQFGLYLVGWFTCDQWNDPKDSERRKHTPKISIEEARKQFDVQAKELSQAGVEIRAFVMNTALR